MKDLTISNIERQNVLNNRFAVSKVQEHLDIEGMLFEGEYRFTKKMVADFYEVEERTIERYLEKHSDELAANGYVLCKGKHLKELKLISAHSWIWVCCLQRVRKQKKYVALSWIS